MLQEMCWIFPAHFLSKCEDLYNESRGSSIYRTIDIDWIRSKMTNLQTCPPGGNLPSPPPPSPSPSSCGNCVFPFIMYNRTHDRCTTILGTNPLCATTSNYDQDGQFEWCTDSTCPGVAPPTETMTVSPGNEVGSCSKLKY